MKQILLSLLGLSIVTVSGCTAPHAPTPEDVLCTRRMKKLLIDIHLHEATARQQQALTYDSMNKLSTSLFRAALSKHNVSESLYLRSTEHYSTHPTAFQEIYTQILDSLSELSTPLPTAPTSKHTINSRELIN